MLVSFKKLSAFDCFLLAYPLLVFLTRNFVLSQVPLLKSNTLLISLFAFLGYFLGGSIDIIYYSYLYFSKKNRVDTKTRQNIFLNSANMAFTKVEQLPDWQKRSFTIIFLVVMALFNIFIIYFQNIILRNLANPAKSNKLFYAFSEIVFKVILSYFILKIRVYSHHYGALVFIVIGNIGLFYQAVDFSAFFDTVPYYLIFSLFYSVLHPYFKVVMEMKYIRPLQFCFYYGLVGVAMILVAFGICQIVAIENAFTKDILNLFIDFRKVFDNWVYSIFIIWHIIGASITNPGSLLIMYYENPAYETMLRWLLEVFAWIQATITNFGTVTNFVLSILGSIFFWFGVLLYQEFIVLHCFGLGDYTKEGIIKRASEEILNESQVSLIEIDDQKSNLLNDNV